MPTDQEIHAAVDKALVEIIASATKARADLAAKPTIPPVPPPVPPIITGPNVINVTSLGVQPGAADQQQQLQRAIDQTPAGAVLWFPAGEYRHSGRLTVSRGITVRGDARKARLIGTTPNTMAIHLRGKGAALEGLTIEGVGLHRLADWESCGVVLFGEDQSVRNCAITRSSAAGIQIEGATRFVVAGNIVTGTLSDSIHCTGGANNGLVESNVVDNSGDDCLAVVSYGGQTPCHHIVVRANKTSGGRARGASVVGGEDITIEANFISGTRAAGVYIASEPSYNTEASKRITVKGNTLARCNTDPTIQHGGIFVWGGRADRPVDGVELIGNEVRDTVNGRAHIVANGANIRNMRMDGNRTFGTLGHDETDTPVTRTGATHNGVRLPDTTV